MIISLRTPCQKKARVRLLSLVCASRFEVHHVQARSEDQVSKIKSLKPTYAKTHIKGEAEVKLAKVEALALKMDEKSEMGTY